MNIDWNVTPINGQQVGVFFSRESYERYSVHAKHVLHDDDTDNSCSSTKITAEDDYDGASSANESVALQDLGSSCLPIENGANSSSRQLSQQYDSAAADKVKLEKTSPNSISLSKCSSSLPSNEEEGRNVARPKYFPYPRRSFLTKQEQESYIKLSERFKKNCSGNSPEERKQLSYFKELQLKVLAEQQEYMVYLENSARQNQECYTFIHPEVNEFVMQYLEAGRKHVLQYPRYYTQHDAVSIAVLKPAFNVSLQHVDTLLEMGTVPQLKEFHNLEFHNKRLPLDAVKVMNRSRKNTTYGDFKSTDKKVVSEDQNASKLAVKHRVDIVTTFSALQCLFDNHGPGYDHQWELPVVVKEYTVNEHGREIKHKVVYLDKPFVPKTMTQTEKNLLYHKSALKVHMLNVKHVTSHSFQSNDNAHLSSRDNDGNVVTQARDECFDINMVDEDKLEVFGTQVVDKLNINRKKNYAVHSTFNSSRHNQVSDPITNNLQSRDVGSRQTTEGYVDSTTKKGVERNSVSVYDAATDDESEDGDSMRIDLDGGLPSPIVSLDGLTDKKDETKSRYSLRRTESAKTVAEQESSDVILGDHGKCHSDESKNGGKPQNMRRSRRISNQKCLDISTGTDSDSEGKLVVCSTDDIKSPLSSIGRAKAGRRRQSSEVVASEASANENKAVDGSPSITTITSNEINPDTSSVSVTDAVSPILSCVILKEEPGSSRIKQESSNENSQKNDTFSKAGHRGSVNIAHNMSPLDKILLDQRRTFDNQPSLPSGASSHLPNETVSLPPHHSAHLPKETATLVSVLPGVGLSSVRLSTAHSQPSLSSPTFNPSMDISTQSGYQQPCLTSGSRKRPLSEPALPEMSEDAALFEKPLNGNVGYHLWALGGLRLLIRQRYHAVNKLIRRKHAFFVHLVPKLEYQPAHGVEVCTVREMHTNWLTLHLKRNTQLLRARVNVFTSEIMLFENIPERQINLQLNASSAVGVLHTILERVKGLDSGNYLLAHTAGNAHLQIKKNTKSERGVYDLHLAYSSSAEAPPVSKSPWVPIDTSIRLPFHDKYLRIPCTFDPKVAGRNHGAQKMSYNGKEKKKTN